MTDRTAESYAGHLDGESNGGVPKRGRLVYDRADQNSKTEILAKFGAMSKAAGSGEECHDRRTLLSLAVSVAAEHSVLGVLNTIVRGLAAQPHVALARIWLVSPGDICDACFMRAECPDHTQCLHLTASAGNPANAPGEDWTFLQGHFRRMPLNVRKVGEVGATEQPILIKDFAPENRWIANVGLM